jgi:hypothetical protein
MKLRVQALCGLFLAAILSIPAWGVSTGQNQNSAVPGTINYVEGKAYVGDQPLDQKSVGKTNLEVGQVLNTDVGKVEVLLTPGVFLRVGDSSSVTMLANGLTDTQVKVTHGHAMVEVDDIYPQNNLRVSEGSAVARLMKPGLYDFNLRQGEMRVFDGEAVVQDGDKEVKLKKDHELNVTNTAQVKAVSFNNKENENGDLYTWSSLRSSYLAEANVDEANLVSAAPYWGWGWGGWGWGWGGWGWDPWFGCFTFMPWGGTFFSPYGWGFYSPWTVYRAPIYPGHYFHTFNAANVHAWGAGEHYVTSKDYSHGVYTGKGASRGAFHSGPVMARGRVGGLFHGGGGGFHGGGAGGFHGGGGLGGGGGHGGH